MKLFIGWVATSGVLLTAAAADAQVLVPYRIGAAPTVVSDVGGPYAALPPGDFGPRYAPAVLPPRAIDAMAREMGFQPLGAPQQRGVVYTLSAINIDGEDGRLVIDARSGRILRFMPAYRMGDRMGEEVVTTYGPAGPVPELPQYRRAPQPRAALPKVASRTPSVPLPKAPPARAVATPTKPVAAAPVAVAVPPAAPAATTPAAPAEQQAVVQPKPDEARVIPMTPAPAAAVAPAPATPTVAPPPVEAKPAAPAAEATPAAPPVQGVE